MKTQILCYQQNSSFPPPPPHRHCVLLCCVTLCYWLKVSNPIWSPTPLLPTQGYPHYLLCHDEHDVNCEVVICYNYNIWSLIVTIYYYILKLLKSKIQPQPWCWSSRKTDPQQQISLIHVSPDQLSLSHHFIFS